MSDNQSDVLLNGDDTWSNEGEWDEDSSGAQCPFCDEILKDAASCFSHTKLVHDFDFYGIRQTLGMKLIGDG